MKRNLIWIIAAIFIAIGIMGEKVSAEEIVVEKGDTLWELAKERETTVDQLMKINNLTTTTIYPGQVLKTEEEKEDEVVEEEEEFHTYKIEWGDTLWEIAQEYDVTVSQLMKWNNLTSDLIFAGESLQIDLNAEKEEVEVAVVIEQPSQSQSTSKTQQKQQPKQTAQAPAQSQQKEQATTQEKPQGRTMMVEATAYTIQSAGGSGITATGINLNQNPDMKVIAVDPSVIPLGTKVYVEGYGYAIAGDTGGAIKGNKIDLYMRYHQDAINWGRRTVQLTIIE